MTSKFYNLEGQIRKGLKWGILLSVMILVAASALGCTQADATDPAQTRAKPVTVTNISTQEVSEMFVAIGTVVPEATYEVATASGGKVVALSVEEGQEVSKGDLLYTLDQTSLMTNREQTERSLSSSIASLTDQVASTSDQLADIQADLLDTNEKLAGLEDNIATESVKKQLETTKEQLESSEDQLTVTLRSLKRQLSDARANYKTQLETIDTALEERLVVSPADGIVTGVNFKVGEILGPQDVLRIIADNSFAVEAPLTASQLREIAKAKSNNTLTINVLLEGDPSRQVPAELERTDVIQNPTNGLYHVRLAISAEDLYDGEYVEIHFTTEKRMANTLPLAAIKRLGSDAFAFAVEEGTAKRVALELGEIVGESVEILSGLEAYPQTSQWIVKGVDDLQDGAKISVSEE